MWKHDKVPAVFEQYTHLRGFEIRVNGRKVYFNVYHFVKKGKGSCLLMCNSTHISHNFSQKFLTSVLFLRRPSPVLKHFAHPQDKPSTECNCIFSTSH